MALVLWAGTKFDRAITVIIAVHRETADAFAFPSALVAVPAHIAEMLMRAFVVQIFDSVGFRDEPPTYASGIRVPIICD
jgi:hypothetical protein